MSAPAMGAQRIAAAAVIALSSLAANAATAANQPLACSDEAALAQLDFWVGDWEVCVGGQRAGRDRVVRILDGCAITESWTGSDGSRGESLFYYSPSEKQWRQVWVTDQALRPGGLKEKHLIARSADGGTRFQGEIALPDGRRILDRTTLRPAANGSVSQRIEISRDGGESWTMSFDATYHRARVDAASAAGGGGRCGQAE
ncbi:MAG: hypothetical protein ABI460_17040 [Caldimonas sp.]